MTSAEALEAVIRHATDPDGDHDDIAPTVDALAASGGSSLLPRLHEALERFLDEQNFYGRDLVAGVLAGVAGTAALPALLLAAARDLGDDQDSLRAEITDLLEHDPVAGRRAVLDLVRTGTAEGRRAGLLMLGAVAEPGDDALLAEGAAHPDPAVRLTAIEAMPDRVSPALVAALRDPDEAVRLAAVGRLGAVAPLTAVAADPSRRVRARVAYALGMLRLAEATPTLLRLLADPDDHVRDQALDSLGAVGGARRRAGRRPHPAVRQRVSVVVGHLAPDQADAVLRRLAEDPVATVREVATTQLGRLRR